MASKVSSDVADGVANLVSTLNGIRGVKTFSGCGAGDDFTVQFDVTHNSDGWQAIAAIARAATTFDDRVMLTAQNDTDPKTEDFAYLGIGTYFTLTGDANPDEVAAAIKANIQSAREKLWDGARTAAKRDKTAAAPAG